MLHEAIIELPVKTDKMDEHTSLVAMPPFEDFSAISTFCLESPSPTTWMATSMEPLVVWRNTFFRVASVSSAANGGSRNCGILIRGSIT
jgi:hypothetical protein